MLNTNYSKWTSLVGDVFYIRREGNFLKGHLSLIGCEELKIPLKGLVTPKNHGTSGFFIISVQDSVDPSVSQSIAFGGDFLIQSQLDLTYFRFSDASIEEVENQKGSMSLYPYFDEKLDQKPSHTHAQSPYVQFLHFAKNQYEMTLKCPTFLLN
ncbi:MAG: hypothetical protein JXR03_18235 [Cyclobacteriaceae bacterium]